MSLRVLARGANVYTTPSVSSVPSPRHVPPRAHARTCDGGGRQADWVTDASIACPFPCCRHRRGMPAPCILCPRSIETFALPSQADIPAPPVHSAIGSRSVPTTTTLGQRDHNRDTAADPSLPPIASHTQPAQPATSLSHANLRCNWRRIRTSLRRIPCAAIERGSPQAAATSCCCCWCATARRRPCCRTHTTTAASSAAGLQGPALRCQHLTPLVLLLNVLAQAPLQADATHARRARGRRDGPCNAADGGAFSTSHLTCCI